jgi:hypothetical protein
MTAQFHRDIAAAIRIEASAYSTTSTSKVKARLVAEAKAHEAEAARLDPQPVGGKSTGTARPFSETGPWNTPIPDTLWYDSPRLRTLMPIEQTQLNQSTNIRHWYVAETSVGVHWAQPSDPTWMFNLPAFVDTRFNRNRPASTFSFRGPANMIQGSDDDHILVVVDMSTGDMVEVWQAVCDPATRTVTGQAWARSNVNLDPGAGSTVNPYVGLGTNDGVRASNFSWLAGLITGRDLAAPSIDHALVVSLGYVTLDNTTGRAPATAPDNGAHNGPILMGDRIGIPRTVAAPSGLSPLGLKMFTALQTFGAYVGDFVGSAYPMFYTDMFSVPEATPAVRRLFVWWDGYIPDMDLISPHLRVAGRQPSA